MGEHTLYLNKNRYWGVFEGAKHDSEARIARNKVDPINVKVCMSRKANTSRYGRKPKFGILIEEERKPKEKIRNPEKFAARGS
jgi:hypothetical protein